MLNHTYTSVKNANLVDCGKKQHIPSQPTPLLKENFLGEFRTELDKKKVLAALGIATELSLEWGNIGGEVGDSDKLMAELDARTKYTSSLDNLEKTIGEGIADLEKIVGNDKTKDDEQDQFINQLKEDLITLNGAVTSLSEDLSKVTDTDIPNLSSRIDAIGTAINNITNLVAVSAKEDNALQLIAEEGYEGLYVPNLDPRVSAVEQNVSTVEKKVGAIEDSLDSFVTKDDLGGDGTYDFVDQQTYTAHVQSVALEISTIKGDLSNTVKTGEDGHVDTLYVNKISKDNDSGNIKITDSFEMESGIPLDVRFVVEDVEALCNLKVEVCYPGMAVVVKKLNALYILKNPVEGVEFNQEYVSDGKNWKCPEDLVTVALTRTHYDELVKAGSISESVFYYIYEEPTTSTQEPVRKEDETDEEWAERWNDWVRTLKILSQEYMSASWGYDIETKLGQKASSAALNALDSNLKQVQDELADIKGSDSTNSLASLGKSIETIQQNTTELEGRLNDLIDVTDEGKEVGRIVDLETSVGEVKDSLDDYVTKSDLQDNTQEFIFVKTSTYEADKELLGESLTTGQITVGSIEADSLSLNDTNIEVDKGHLTMGGKPIAFSEDLMQVEIIDQDTYNQREQAGDLSDKVYYYTYDGTVSLVTNDDLNSVKKDLKDLQSLVGKLQQDLAALQQIVQESNPTT